MREKQERGDFVEKGDSGATKLRNTSGAVHRCRPSNYKL